VSLLNAPRPRALTPRSKRLCSTMISQTGANSKQCATWFRLQVCSAHLQFGVLSTILQLRNSRQSRNNFMMFQLIPLNPFSFIFLHCAESQIPEYYIQVRINPRPTHNTDDSNRGDENQGGKGRLKMPGEISSDWSGGDGEGLARCGTGSFPCVDELVGVNQDSSQRCDLVF
jgi:hypothetical protein